MTLVTFEKYLPIALIVLDICASGVYAYCHDWRKTIYWLAAAVLTSCVTF